MSHMSLSHLTRDLSSAGSGDSEDEDNEEVIGNNNYGVAMMSKLLENIGLFCRI